MSALLSSTALEFSHAIAARFDKRIAASKSATVKNLLDARKKLISHAATLEACNFNLDAIDGSNGEEFNVYALQRKVHNFCEVIAGNDTLNDYNRALFLTARALFLNGNSNMTQRDAECAADGDFKAKSEREQLYAVNAVSNTIDTNKTQRSSTLVALCAMNILSRNGKNFSYNSSAYATQKLLAALALNDDVNGDTDSEE